MNWQNPNPRKARFIYNYKIREKKKVLGLGISIKPIKKMLKLSTKDTVFYQDCLKNITINHAEKKTEPSSGFRYGEKSKIDKSSLGEAHKKRGKKKKVLNFTFEGTETKS